MKTLKPLRRSRVASSLRKSPVRMSATGFGSMNSFSLHAGTDRLDERHSSRMGWERLRHQVQEGVHVLFWQVQNESVFTPVVRIAAVLIQLQCSLHKCTVRLVS